MIRIGTYQSVSEDSRCEHEPVSDLCPDIEPDSDSSNYEPRDEERKDQETLYYQDQKVFVLIPCRNPRSLRQDD